MMTRGERPCDETIRMLLERVVSSRAFARSERLRAFFRYVVTKELEGSGHQLKGYTIGIDVFGRNQAFNADSDPLVRVHAGKLRKLLDAYYEDEGAGDEWRIAIPKGTYVPDYLPRVADPRKETAPSAVLAPATPVEHSPPAAASKSDGRRSHQARAGGWLPAPLSSPLALLSALPLLVLATVSSPGMSGNLDANAKLVAAIAAPSGVSHELPHLAIRSPWPADGKTGKFADAMRMASGNYSTIANESAAPRRRTDANAMSALAFSIEVTRQESPQGVAVTLLHDRSGERLRSDFIADERLADEADILFESVAIVSKILSVRGDLFRYSANHDIQSTLMQCMVVTDTYRREQTRDTFQAAKACQERLSPTHRSGLAFSTSATALSGVLKR